MAVAALSKGGNHVRDASFSSYLDTADMDFVRSLAASVHESSPVFTPSRQSSSSSPSPSPMSKKRITRRQLGELGVFRAESYFSEKVLHRDDHQYDDMTPRSIRHSKELAAEEQVSRAMKHKYNSTRTPSIKSESSWNSQSRLLASSRNTDQAKPKKSPGGLRFFAGFQCKGSCYDKAPVYTSHLIKIKQPSNHQTKGFWEDQVVQISAKKQPLYQPRHRIAAPGTKKKPEKILPNFAFPAFKDTEEEEEEEEDEEEEEERMSIEIFGSHGKTKKKLEADNGNLAINMERKLSMMSWDAIPISSQHNRRSSGSCRFDDMDSDASSDLFDIPVFPAEMSPVTAPYEPSEASIEWSVVTASAAEFSAVSDHDVDERQIEIKTKKMINPTPIQTNKLLKAKPKEAAQRSMISSGGILGCKSDKAVKVVAPAARMASYPPLPPRKPHISAGPVVIDSQVFSPANSSFASKTATTTTITAFSPSPSSSARAPRAIYMY